MPEGGEGSLTRKQRWVVAGVTAVLVAAAAGMVVFSLQRPPVQEYLPTTAEPIPVGDSLVGPEIYTVDASSSSEWIFFDFSRGAVVNDPAPGEWDLAFQRFYIVANGGVGFAGRGGLLDLGPVPFDSVKVVPENGYVASEAGRDTTNAATAEWYDYSFTSHLLTPRPR
ncbi:MAG: HmuY family protein, partial [Longimicrobiales bacterium]|nr:HmuY family protein [Longimicrobiales bacterium]